MKGGGVKRLAEKTAESRVKIRREKSKKKISRKSMAKTVKKGRYKR